MLLSIPFCVLIAYKENFFNVDHAIDNYPNQKYLIGYVYNEDNYRYLKYKALSNNNSIDVLALGSSRVLQFRENMFKGKFYNAGYTVTTLDDFKIFLSTIPKNNIPGYLIIGLDQWMFNPTWEKINYPESLSSYTTNNSGSFKKGLGTFKIVWQDILKKKIAWPPQNADSGAICHIGMNAMGHKFGFRNDGSMDYGIEHNRSENANFKSKGIFDETMRRIKSGNKKFQYGDELSERSLRVLRELLTYCKINNIKVIGFLPPFADSVHKVMMQSGKYKYIESIMPRISPLFEEFNFEIYSYNNAFASGSSDNEMLDGFHGGEKTYLRVLIDMLKKGSTLNSVCDIDELSRQLLHSENDYVVYGY